MAERRTALAVPEPPKVVTPGNVMQTIEREIIPRLVLAHRDEAFAACADARPPPTTTEIADFGKLVITQSVPAAIEVVERLATQGLALESIFLDLFGKTARWLGDRWLDDQISFVDVTAGLGTLQQLVNVLGPNYQPVVPSKGTVLLTAAPGEQHTLGLFLLGEFLRQAEWGVDVLPGMTAAELGAYVARTHVEALGLTVGREDMLPSLARAIELVRRESRNPELAIMIGGRIDLTEFAARHGVTALENPPWAVRWLNERRARDRRSPP